MDLPASAELQELTNELHAANERFDAARVEWEKWLGVSEFRHEERVESARAALMQAEKEVEAVEEKIRQVMGAS